MREGHVVSCTRSRALPRLYHLLRQTKLCVDGGAAFGAIAQGHLGGELVPLPAIRRIAAGADRFQLCVAHSYPATASIQGLNRSGCTSILEPLTSWR